MAAAVFASKSTSAGATHRRLRFATAGRRICAYLNRCAHVAMELDWQPGMFFDFDAEYLLCSTHGAFYDPITGACRGGACTGYGGLRALTVVEQDGRVLWQPDGYAEPLRPAI